MTEELLQECRRYVESGGLLSGSRFTPVRITHRRLAQIDAGAAANWVEENKGQPFTQQLFAYIDRTGKPDSTIYKKAYIDRRLFSKIRSNKNYIPAKKTVLALCLALELPRAEADGLLASAGYSLSSAEEYDLVIAFCMEKKIFNFMDINELLDHFGMEIF